MSKNLKIILASTSERRISIIKQLGISNFEVVKPNFNENCFESNKFITKHVLEKAFMKASSVIKRFKEENFLVISGDTEVYRSGMIFTKSNSEKKVKNYLESLSGKKHFVFGGICVISSCGVVSKKCVKSEVYFDRIPKNELLNKALIKEGLGKSGGYAIQGIASKFVRKIRGSYSNIVGLSIYDLNLILGSFGFKN